MATVFFVRDGPRGNTTSEGQEHTAQNLTQLSRVHQIQYFGGEPPEFNANAGRIDARDFTHVVIEVMGNELTPPAFPEVGFYLVQNLTPAQFADLFPATP